MTTENFRAQLRRRANLPAEGFPVPPVPACPAGCGVLAQCLTRLWRRQCLDAANGGGCCLRIVDVRPVVFDLGVALGVETGLDDTTLGRLLRHTLHAFEVDGCRVAIANGGIYIGWGTLDR